jgi:predicted HD superfamily hydrolase involved in NAD metabolism
VTDKKENSAVAKDKERLDLCRTLEKELKYSRFIHTLGVAFTATSLAERYGADMHKAETAGLLHDCAKYLDVSDMEKLCNEGGIPITKYEKGNGALLHSKAGTVLARTKYGVTDPEILKAIQYHTTGEPSMTLLEKIIFIADYMEPGRNSAPNLDRVRTLAFENIDQCLIQILSDTLQYLSTTGKEIDPMTKRTYEYYCEKENRP